MAKNFALIFFFFILLFSFAKFGPGIPLSVNQTTTTKPEPFMVSAEGKATGVPDVAEISLGFTTTSPAVATAQNQANQTINGITAAVKKLGIADADIRTTNYNLRPDYDYQAKPQRITGYSIDVNIQVKVRDFAKINQVIDAGTANNANQVGNLNFTFADAEKYQAQARRVAIDNAKKKAADIAAASGLSLGKLINVSENSANFPRPMLALDKTSSAGLGGGIAPTQIEPGSSEITVSVTLSYETR
jgi:uncharacterized protein